MHEAALFMALAMVWPRKMAAAAIAAPTMARIRAFRAKPLKRKVIWRKPGTQRVRAMQTQKAAPKDGLSRVNLGVRLDQQALALCALTHDAALFMALAMVWPRKIAAAAMAAPTIARIRAYSAAEAPFSSFK